MMRRVLIGLAASVVMAAGSASALAQGTAITYQGQLRNAGTAVSTPTDMQFSLFTAATGGTQVGSTVTVNAVAVNQGLFTTPIDFGVNPYTSNQALFLQIAVRNPAGAGAFVPMGARQAITPAPFSLATRGLSVDSANNTRLAGNLGIGGPADTNIPISIQGSFSDSIRLWNLNPSSTNGLTLFPSTGQVVGKIGYTNAGAGGVLADTLNIHGTRDVLFAPSPQFQAERMRIKADTGNVGIANATPPELLSVGSFGVAGAFDRYIQISTQGGNQYRAGLKLRHFNNDVGYTIESDERGSGVGGTSNGLNFIDMNFGVGAGSPQSVLFIRKQTGFVGIGTTAPAARLHNTDTTRLDGELQLGAQTFSVASGSNARLTRTLPAPPAGGAVTLDLSSPAGVFNDFIISNNGSSNIILGNDGFAAKPGGGAWSVLSDERTKSDVQELSGTLDRLLKLKGHSYTYKPEFVESGKALPGMQIGLVAQEVEEVFPDWVTTGRDGLKVVTERSTTALMVEAMRDLRNEKDAEIKALKARVDEMSALKARLEKLEALLAAQGAGK